MKKQLLVLTLLVSGAAWAQQGFDVIGEKTLRCWEQTGDIHGQCNEEKPKYTNTNPTQTKCHEMKKFVSPVGSEIQKLTDFTYSLPATVKINEGKSNELRLAIDEDGYTSITNFHYPRSNPKMAESNKKYAFKDLYRYTFKIEQGQANENTGWKAPESFSMKIVGYKLEIDDTNPYQLVRKLYLQLSSGDIALLDGENILGTYRGAHGDFNPYMPAFASPAVLEVTGRESLNFRNKFEKFGCSDAAILIRETTNVSK